MNERSLISLTAIALLTGVILLVVGHAFIDFLSTEPPQTVAELGQIDDDSLQEFAPTDASPRIRQTLYDSTLETNEPVESPELSSALPPQEEPQDVVPLEIEVDEPQPTEPELTLAAPGEEDLTCELTLQAPTVAVEEPVSGLNATVEATEEPFANETAKVHSASEPGPALEAVPYDDEVPPAYEPQDEFVENPVPLSPSPAMPPSVALEAPPQGLPAYTFEGSTSMAPNEPVVASISDTVDPDAVATMTAAVSDFPPAMPQAPTSPLEEQHSNLGLATPKTFIESSLQLGASPTRVAQVPLPGSANDMLEDEAERALRSEQDDAPAPGEPEIDSKALENEETKLGEAPEETNNELQFLRRQSVLLEPGQYQFDVSLQYLINESDSPLAQVADEFLQIGEALRKQRLLLVPIEFRLGLTPVSQLFVNVPFGWSNGEISFLGVDEFQNSGGLGDVSAGITRMLMEGNDWFPDVLTTLAFSAPTGDSNFVTSLSTPGNALGQGFWTTTIGLSFIQTFDPVVVFYGFGYRHRYENTFDVNIGDGRVTVNPGKQIFYSFGAGFAVNPRVTLSASFNGSYITEDVVEGVRLAGSIREPMNVRLAATITKDKELKKNQRVRTIEPFVNIGLTDAAANAVFGVSCTH